MEIKEIWKVMDVGKEYFTQGFIDEISFFSPAYEDSAVEIREHLYNAVSLLDDAENEIIDITNEEVNLLKEIKELQEINNCFYFRIVN